MPPATPPPRKLRDPNEIFASLESSPVTSPPVSGSKQPVATPRLKSIKRRLLNGNSFLNRSSPSRGRRSPPLSGRKVSKSAPGVGSGNGLKFDVGTPLGDFDRGKVRERVRQWQANGGGVVSGDPVIEPPIHKSFERKLVASYTVNDDFSDLETSSARFGMEPLALPAPPFAGVHKRNSLPNTVPGKDEDWEDVSKNGTPEKQDDWSSAPEDASLPSRTRTKRRRRRVPKEPPNPNRFRDLNSSTHSLGRPTSTKYDSDHETKTMSESTNQIEYHISQPKDRTESQLSLVSSLENHEGVLIPLTKSRSPSPPPPPAHTSNTTNQTPSITATATPSITSGARSIDDDGIRVKATRKASTHTERLARHRQRLKEREEFLERERQRVREEEIERIRKEERERELERTKEIERIREEERKRVLEEERIREEEKRRAREEEKQREEERRKMREFDRQLEKEREKERELRKQKEKEREERRKEREREKEREKEKERERIREEERAKIREEARLEQERERIRDEERRRLRHEDEKHHEIMSEIERANQRRQSVGKRRVKGKDQELMDAVQRKIEVEHLQGRDNMKESIKQAVKEVMAEMFGDIMTDDLLSQRNSQSSSTEHRSEDTYTEADLHEPSTRNTTPDADWSQGQHQSDRRRQDNVGVASASSRSGSHSASSESLKSSHSQGRAQSLGNLRTVAPLSPPKRRAATSVAPPQPASHKSNATSTDPEDMELASKPESSPQKLSRSRQSINHKRTAPSLRKRPSRSSSKRDASVVDELVSRQPSRSIGGAEPEEEYFVSVNHPLPRSSIKRFTSHADLISILSEDKLARPKSVKSVSARSKLTVSTLTMDDLMGELVIDETKYRQELKTLIESVVPAIVNTTMSGSEKDIAVGINRATSIINRQKKIKPVVDMGTVLDELKNIHDRIPSQYTDDLLEWAKNAKLVYEDYLKYWHMGYEELFIEVPVDESNLQDKTSQVQKVDVAYLLKRPLVRSRLLTKLFKRINYLKPSPLAQEIFSAFQNLVILARRKVAEETARLEDETAACIDASRVQDLHTLEPCYGVILDPSLRVRARDTFTMNLLHTIGRVIQSSAELYIRDEGRKSKSANAELMICRTEGRDKWLAFPPISLADVVAEQGASEAEMDLTVTGTLQTGEIWTERINLVGEPMINMEWLHLLGASAMEICKASKLQLTEAMEYELPVSEAVVVNEDIPKLTTDDILGEINAQMRDLGFEEPPSIPSTPACEPQAQPEFVPVQALNKKPKISSSEKTTNASVSRKPMAHIVMIPGVSDLFDGGELVAPDISELSLLYNSAPHFTTGQIIASPPASTVYPDSSASYGRNRGMTRKVRELQNSPTPSPSNENNHEKHYPNLRSANPSPQNPYYVPVDTSHTLQTQKSYATLSFTIDDSQTKSAVSSRSGLFEGDEQETSSDSGSDSYSESDETESGSHVSSQATFTQTHTPATEDQSSGSTYLPPPPLVTRRTLTPVQEHDEEDDEEQPLPPLPPQPVPPPKDVSKISLHSTPVIAPQNQQTSKADARAALRRRHSSPLKHEYAPSSSSDESESSDSESESDTASGESSEDESSDLQSTTEEEPSTPSSPVVTKFSNQTAHVKSGNVELAIAPIKPKHTHSRKPSHPPTFKPSDLSAPIAFNSPAFVFRWANNTWEKVYPNECKLTIIPGQVTASVMELGEDGLPKEGGEQLLTVDLNPITPVRRGTAVDLSISSPPTGKSQGSSVMFRSRNPQDCETLYNAINSARLNQMGGPSRNPSISRQGSVRGYRAMNTTQNTSPTFFPSEAPSIISTEGSMGSFSSALSALKGGFKGGLFKGGLNKSASGSWMSSSSTSSGLAGPRGIINPLGGIPITGIGGEAPYAGTGYISNLKIQLYKRESATKWADLGPGHLNVITPAPGHAARGGGGLNSREKRVVVRDKKGLETLLDAVLGEACFERIARTGIAIHVPNEDDGYIPNKVMAKTAGRSAIYMLQLKTEMETSETFKIVGKQGY